MSRVDFYVLSEGGPDAGLRQACRLAEQAAEQGCCVYVQTASHSESQRLDELLWTFSDRSFLVHELYSGSPASHPLVRVMLGDAPAPPTHRQLLINLSGTLPPDIETYGRIAEIVETDPQRKRSARERYKQYRERGCTLESHNL